MPVGAGALAGLTIVLSTSSSTSFCGSKSFILGLFSLGITATAFGSRESRSKRWLGIAHSSYSIMRFMNFQMFPYNVVMCVKCDKQLFCTPV